MNKTFGWALGAALLMAGCAPTTGEGGFGEYRYLRKVPDGVLAIAAPYQNLDAVVLKPEDGCYWYRHDGVVESTLLPLRTPNGNPICSRPQN